MSILHAIVLAIVQGVTEFLPISSSGHLLILPWMLHWRDSSSLTFDVMLHAGTLVAILIYFWSDLKRILTGSLMDMRKGRFGKSPDSRLLLLIVLGSIPTGIVGVKFDKIIENNFRTMYLGVAAVMIVVGIILYMSDKYGKKQHSVEKLSVRDALVIGLAQSLALFPGVSRSGATITAGLFTGLTREASARFSFLLATPVILGASLIKLQELGTQAMKHQPLDAPVSMLLVGFVVSALMGYISIAVLLKFLRSNSMLAFILYRLVFGLSIIAVYFMRIDG